MPLYSTLSAQLTVMFLAVDRPALLFEAALRPGPLASGEAFAVAAVANNRTMAFLIVFHSVYYYF
jgi:hypothetical protein